MVAENCCTVSNEVWRYGGDLGKVCVCLQAVSVLELACQDDGLCN